MNHFIIRFAEILHTGISSEQFRCHRMRKRKMHALICSLFFIFAMPSFVYAQGGAVQQALNQAALGMKQNNTMMAVASVISACSILKANPSAMPGSNYLEIAGKNVDEIKNKISSAESRHDTQTITRDAVALQQLLNSLIGWDSQNPRWHYELGWVNRSLSKTVNDKYPQYLEAAVREFKAALASAGGGSYRNNAQNMLSSSESLLRQCNSNASDYKRTHPLHNLNNQAKPAAVENAICGSCGREHPSGFRCPYCGGGF